MYPSRCPETAPRSEKTVFEQLSQLDDDFVVFHSVPWQGKRHGKQGDGEADFVVAHPNKGVLILEVKGGAIDIDAGQWISQSRNGERHKIRNPFEQAADSKFKLREYLAEHVPRLRGGLRCGHAVAFPSIEVAGDLSTDGPRSIVLDRNDLRDIEKSIGRVMSHWEATRLDDQQFSALRKALVPTTKIRRTQKQNVEDVVEQLLELTEQQASILQFLKRQRRALITGGAGTGKTVLAVEKAKQLAADGFSVLLLCFNAPLGDELANSLTDESNITAGNFHKVAMALVKEAKLETGAWGDDFWDVQLPELVPDAAEKLGRSFDAVIVDEGQDFHDGWWTTIELLLSDPDDGILYVFADDHQDLYRTGWAPPFEAEPFQLDINCRNTVEIGERVNAIFDRDEPSLGVSGQKPGFVEAKGKKAAEKIVQFVNVLLGEGMPPESIAVLTQKKPMAQSLRGVKVGDIKLTEPGKPGVTVETIHRFKGLEADAVALWLEEIEDVDDRVLAYVGMSRARALLLVVGPAELKENLAWT